MNDFKHIGSVTGFRRAMEVADRMKETAPTAEEQRKRIALEAGSYDPRLCPLCDGTGFLEMRPNVVRECDCRIQALEAARRKEQERDKPKKDLVDFLLDDENEREED